jgi:hypothetical protein
VQAFALADKRLQELVTERRHERLAGAIIGSLAMAGCTTGFIWGELSAPEGSSRMGPRLGWGGGFLAGGLMLGDALWRDDSAESLAKIWRDDPSLTQYQTSLSLSSDGAFISLAGAL